MPDMNLIPAWTALFMGLFGFFVGIGALRRPDHWERLLAEIAASPALQVVTGLVEMAIGGVVYLANPWDSADWLSSALAVVGGLLVLEALAIIAFSDIYLAFWVRRFGPLARLWAWCSIAVGVAAMVIAALRF
ncbi:hypothetical protein [Novosphingobium colocasiae]|uniref:DUF2065 domain-containing protein n=1 Tax=Novosphingobium colocasiae TaxID=1256513 RepID=A0A918PL43_9SPHN|nr:hypothetical protein [Novosphingobium colocasiae]GGZ14706.1 hypothetical protein GCM10011614_32040 [Novosphingobium colocasiae]